jgi:Family of unknown function (DUF6069)
MTSIIDSAESANDTSQESSSHRCLIRAAAVCGAALTTTAIFLIGRAAGADFTITDPGQGKIPHTFVAVEIATVTAVIGLLGWVVLAALERWTQRPRKIWSVLALVVVALSLVPIWIERADTDTRIGLAVIHIAVAVALLPLLRTASDRSGVRPAGRS